MIEIIKNKIWNLLKKKKVSLVMLYDKDGKIAWSKGRKISGKTIFDGEGFSKTYIEKSLKENQPVKVDSVILSSTEGPLVSQSVMILHIKSLLILPVSDSFYLYIDSGTRDSFTQLDYELFKIMGEFLGEIVNLIKKNQTNVGGITGSSKITESIRDRVADYSIIEEPVLLRGETGTGKNHIAELIHIYSGKSGKFKVINTPGIPQNLFESEMFGHKKGAFTDARYDKKGLIEEAEGGTLFIDEITEIPIAMQAKLLRFVETKAYTVLGESEERSADVRIIAATNKDIGTAISEKEFREDLYYRLNVLEIDLPPLRERKEDIKDLVYEKIKYLEGKQIGEGFWDAMVEHDWPGNIRELMTVIKRAGLCEKDTVDGNDIKNIINMSIRNRKPFTIGGKLDTIRNEMKNGRNFWEAVKIPYLDRQLNRDEVKTILDRALEETGGKYKRLMSLFNLEKSEYKNFMRFLYENRLK